ncbi:MULTISPECIES: polysaccharide deacetylase family protein [Rhizobium/Agrobacterium group]|uniref:polysaccharide deacetylase family protein n=1 Tax=Rhizobium/Agrobacterium group TaxID=227290 RepID=UPI000B403AE6|nr:MULTISPECIES: polysaccharide deacetylase family protein [Rhizobium/Agrobacterium group]MCF1482181.1 polysaccharide deacetylase family protein [Allorhizobium ampelinum]NSZ42041.1 polysaccharide deacetylase family protein [Agrobacterium vitis]NTA25750.1 polysaccharide deacetylase family protein [Allorhizobium ampelinum]OVE96435.1 polysaccharide deacetylase [Allorhizobium ampelinum]
MVVLDVRRIGIYLSSLLLGSMLLNGAAKPALAAADGLIEPKLHIHAAPKGSVQVAVTLDACMGKTDMRILSTLLDDNIKATIFVTGRWIRSNPQAVAVLKSRPDLFEVENHGENHIPAVDYPTTVYGIAAAGSPEAVAREVTGGADAMRAAGFSPPRWYRDATAKYSPSAIAEIKAMGYQIGGFSINGDSGSLLGAKQTEQQFAHAKNGDVLIAHINQPTHAAGEGVVAGLKALKARGVVFVHLSEAGPVEAVKGPPVN